MINRQFISKIFAFFIGIGCVYIAYEFNSKSNTILRGSIYGTAWTINSSDYISDYHQVNINKILTSIDYMASNYKDDSEVSILNKNSLNEYLNISNDLNKLITTAEEISFKTNGSYDITMGKISASKGFSPNFGIDVFDDTDIFSKKYEIQNNQIIRYQDFWFDMSSIAKGFAVQELHEYLVLNNLTNHLIDIGGEVIINGTNGSNPWVVGIQDPRNQSEKPIFLVSNDKYNFLAIATSGEYRNIRFDGDDLITHTFNPFTKKSISGNLESITIVSQNSATLADAYATAVNVMGFEKGIEFVNSNDIAALFIVSDEGELKLIKSQKWYDLGL